MVLYYHFKGDFEGVKDAAGNIVKLPTIKDKIYGVMLTGVYSVLVVVFNIVYKSVALMLTELQNFQYQSTYDNYMIAMLFRFSFLNFYFPLFIIAFIDKEYFTLFMMMAT